MDKARPISGLNNLVQGSMTGENMWERPMRSLLYWEVSILWCWPLNSWMGLQMIRHHDRCLIRGRLQIPRVIKAFEKCTKFLRRGAGFVTTRRKKGTGEKRNGNDDGNDDGNNGGQFPNGFPSGGDAQGIEYS